MDWIFVVLGAILMIAGLVGCILPILPGPPLSFVGLLLLQFQSEPPFTWSFIILWAGIATIVTILDYLIPAYGTKKFGGSREGVWGSIIGLFVGLFFFPPFGIIIGPLAGALVGEMIRGTEQKNALRAAFGSFIGLLGGILLKLIASGIMTYYFVINMW